MNVAGDVRAGGVEASGKRPRPMRRLAAALARPGLDLLRGQARCLARPRDLAVLFLGLLLGWWIYVPLHELLHAAACLAAGGEVWRLEISPLYGGALLASAIPWVVAGGDYAGRLAGFSTGGSDLVYLATDLGPFLLTLFPGVWALRRAARSGRALLFGLAIPFALAPFLSLPGDAYEIGSLAVTQLPAWSGEAAESALRGDDVARVARGLTESEVPGRWTAFALAVVLALAWAWTTWGLGALVARQLGEGPVRL